MTTLSSHGDTERVKEREREDKKDLNKFSQSRDNLNYAHTYIYIIYS